MSGQREISHLSPSICSLLTETYWQTFIVLHFDLLWTHNGKVPQFPNGEAFNNKLLRSIDYTEGRREGVPNIRCRS